MAGLPKDHQDHQSKNTHAHKHTPLGLLGELLTRSGSKPAMACRGGEKVFTGELVSFSACQLVASQRGKTACTLPNKQTNITTPVVGHPGIVGYTLSNPSDMRRQQGMGRWTDAGRLISPTTSPTCHINTRLLGLFR